MDWRQSAQVYLPKAVLWHNLYVAASDGYEADLGRADLTYPHRPLDQVFYRCGRPLNQSDVLRRRDHDGSSSSQRGQLKKLVKIRH